MEIVKECKKVKVIRTIVTKKEVIDNIGMKISAGTELHIINEIQNPLNKIWELIVLVDNGTGVLDLMPKTVIHKHRIE